MKAEVRELAKTKATRGSAEGEEADGPQPVEEVTLNLPSELASAAEADFLIAELEKLKARLAAGARLRVRWQ